jgi:hypothetical protein
MVRCPLDMCDKLQEIADREGKTVLTVVPRLIFSAVNRARAGHSVLSGSEARN